MPQLQIESLDVEGLLEAVFHRYGYDFRNYARSSIERRLAYFRNDFGYATSEELQQAVLEDAEVFETLVSTISVPVTDMFRDPQVYQAIRREVIPYLATFPFPRVWQAGCATGEEVYSMSIVLEEEGLLDRTVGYATDFNGKALTIAEAGRYPAKHFQRFEENYRNAGGNRSLSAYCTVAGNVMQMHESLRKRVLFTQHNLVTDGSFGQVQFAMCRNVLIYFDRKLQSRVLSLFAESLRPNGFLCLGTRETPMATEMKDAFECVNFDARLYIRK